ncbi:putative sec7 domain-containing protein [Erysiphe neolycopersici]|uniref:Putative sec7 domain-containing protein n=1 Tax=Erysiphe neolycopersici TaxID=212602 RepID=A0A420HH81_9PEZI|nr:putative sec7 domain-containing protein [Erysiphe neolycopersici]
MLLDEEDEETSTRWITTATTNTAATPRDAKFSHRLDLILRDKTKGSSPTLDDETNELSQYKGSFFYDISPLESPLLVENKSEEKQKRDSHELDLSPRRAARESLVDHMLLSFDQLKTNPFPFEQTNSTTFGRNFFAVDEHLHSAFDDDESCQTIPNPTTRDGQRIKYQNLYDNDDENTYERDFYSVGQRPQRRHRSTEAQVQALANMIVEQRLDPQVGHHTHMSQRKSQRSQSHSGPRENKNKMDTFFEYSEHVGTQKWTRNQSSRSSSFDYRNGQHHDTSYLKLRSWNTKYDPYQYDKGPISTVHHSSERPRHPSPSRIPHMQSTALHKLHTKLETKKSLKSIKNSIGHKLPERNDSMTTFTTATGPKDSFDERNDIKNQANKISSSQVSNNKRQLSQGISKKESPPSSVIASLSSIPVNSSSQAKERPGFFRRVFGSSRNHVRNNAHGLNLEHSPPHGSSSSIETEDLPKYTPPSIDIKPKSATQNREELLSISPPSPTLPKIPTPHGTSTTDEPEELMPHLDRKSSSFFRRRKKSNPSKATNALPTQQSKRTLHKEMSIDKVLPNPPSNLLSVLHPYLQTFNSSIDIFASPEHEDQYDDSIQESESEALKSFSLSYDPIPSTRIRAVKECEEDTKQTLGLSTISTQQLLMSSNRSRSLKNDYEGIGIGHDSSFHQEYADEQGDTLELNASNFNSFTPHLPSNKVSASSGRKYISESHSPSRNPESSDRDYYWSRSQPLIPRQQMTESPSLIKRTHIARQHSEDWVKISKSKNLTTNEKEDRVWLEPSSDEEESISSQTGIAESVISLFNGTRPDSKASDYGSILSISESLEDKKYRLERLCKNETSSTIISDSRVSTVHEECVSDKDVKELKIAREIFEGNENSVSKDKAAVWLGKEGINHTRVLEFYFRLYDFRHLNILVALRKLCGRLVLKAESQQIDRILVAFSKRWCECNPLHGFKEIDVIHTVAYSLLLLNTDLYIANIDQKMSRSQFIKNTLPTIRKIIIHSSPLTFESTRPTILPGKCVAFEKMLTNQDMKVEETSVASERPLWRSYIRPSAQKFDNDIVSSTPHELENSVDESGPLVETPFQGTLRTWEAQLEMILKTFYNSIRNEPLPLYNSQLEKPTVQVTQSNNNMFLRRTPSILSHTPSDTQSYRSRAADSFLRVGNGKRMNKIRSKPRLYTAGSGLGSSRTSLDDQSSMMSPVSSTWSKYSLGKTPTSISIDSMGSTWPNEKYQQSIGFANAISQAIIREEMIGSSGSNFEEQEESNQNPLLEDESLELHGAPWAKEGLVKHKHHLESVDKRARERNWTDVFAVIEKGYLSLFSFSGKSRRQKTKGNPSQGVVGGGNWQENAQNMGSFLLQQTIASALPSPGYSKARPHVWALSLPTGAVHLFQVGTPDVVKEFVTTANYWGARLSNHPLVGGISNIEYGWSDAVINMVETRSPPGIKDTPKRPTTSSRNRPSISGQNSGPSSGRLSLDLGTSGVPRPRIFSEKIMISDWTPPTQNMRSSNLSEQEQLSALTAYVSGIEEELQKHNKLRAPMLQAFCPRQPNAQKAMANWEKKSAYLLREIVKFTTYIDSLQAALACKAEIYKERDQKNKEKDLVTPPKESNLIKS